MNADFQVQCHRNLFSEWGENLVKRELYRLLWSLYFKFCYDKIAFVVNAKSKLRFVETKDIPKK